MEYLNQNAEEPIRPLECLDIQQSKQFNKYSIKQLYSRDQNNKIQKQTEYNYNNNSNSWKVTSFINKIIFLLYFLFFFQLKTVNASTITVSSNSSITGVNAIYYFDIKNHTKPTKIVIKFSDWSVNQPQPFQSNYQVIQNVTGNALTCNRYFTKEITCLMSNATFSGSVYPTTIVLRMTQISNPSSTKPYLITFVLSNSTASQTINASLTMSNPRSSSFTFDGYSQYVSASSTATLYFLFQNYVNSNTFLNLTYNSKLVSISVNSKPTLYSVITNDLGIKRISGWSTSLQQLGSIQLNVTNTQFAVSFQLQGTLYFIDVGTGVEYKIQSYFLTAQLKALSYSSYGFVQPKNKIYLGVSRNQLNLYTVCNSSKIGALFNSYLNIEYDNTILKINSSSTCVSSTTNGTKSSCKMIINSVTNNNVTNLITQINSLISSTQKISQTLFTVSTYSYFSQLNASYPICSSNINLDLSPQILSPTVNLSTCNSKVADKNNLTIQMNVQNVTISDVLRISNFDGKIINGTTGIMFTFNSSSNSYSASLTSSEINSTKVKSIVYFTNPSYLGSSQPSFSITLSRKLSTNSSLQNIYAQTSSSLLVCPVTSILQSNSNSFLTLQSSQTFKQNIFYSIQFNSSSFKLNDYALNDYFLINFMVKITDDSGLNFANIQSPYQLSKNTNLNILINSQYYLSYQIINNSTLKVILNSTSVVNLFNSLASLNFKINSLVNPIFVCQTYLIFNTYNSNGFKKQKLTTSLQKINSSLNSDIILASNSLITLLASNNTINMNVSSKSSNSYFSIPFIFANTAFLVAKTPFICTNLNSSNQLNFSWPSLSSSSTSIQLNRCTLDYFKDGTQYIEIKQYVTFSHINLTLNLLSTSSRYFIYSSCGDNCHYCNASIGNLNNLSCSSCFNSSYTNFNILYKEQGKCYQTCPAQSFKNQVQSVCQKCHQICLQCNSALYSSCTSCAPNFKMNSKGVCESTCGANKYLNQQNQCKGCNSNCNGCISQDECYACKDGAILINNSTCKFSECQFPCKTCENSRLFCLTCEINYYFYENECFSKCPEGTFQWTDDQLKVNQSQCVQIQHSNLNFIGLILCSIGLIVGFIIRFSSPKKAKYVNLSQNQKKQPPQNPIVPPKIQPKLSKNQSPEIKKKLSKAEPIKNLKQTSNNLNNIKQNKNEEKPTRKVYKLNILRYSVVLLSYIEIISILLILGLSTVYSPSGASELIYIGIAGLVISNIIFGIKYYKNVYKKLMLKRQKFVKINIQSINQSKSKEMQKKMNQNKNKIQIQPQPQPIMQEKDQNPVQQEHINKNIIQDYEQDQQNQAKNNQNSQNNANLINNKQMNIKINQVIINQINQHDFLQSDQQQQNKKYSISKQLKQTQEFIQRQQKSRLFKKYLQQFDNQMLKQITIVGLCTIFTVRTYNILRSNLFYVYRSQLQKDQNNNIQLDLTYHINLNKNKNNSKNNVLQSNRNLTNRSIQNVNMISKSPLNIPANIYKTNININDVKNTQQIQSNRTVQKKLSNLPNSKQNVLKIQSKQKGSVSSIVQNNNINNKTMQIKSTFNNNNSKKKNNIVSKIKPIIEQQSIPQRIQLINPLLEIKQQLINRFLHPFYTYNIIASIIFSTLLWAIASIITILYKRHVYMGYWGIDSLIILSFSFLLTIWDLWKAVNLSHQEQGTQISTQKAKQQINQTMENLKDYQNDNVQEFKEVEDLGLNNINATKKINTANKLSPFKSNKKITNSIINDSKMLNRKKSNQKVGFDGDQIDFNQIKIQKSAKSPTQKTQKKNTFVNKVKSPNNKSSSDNIQFQQQKAPQLKIFDNLDNQDDMDLNLQKFSKAQKIRKRNNTQQQFSSNIRSSNRSLKNKKNITGMQSNNQTSRYNKNRTNKLNDIYLGFLDISQPININNGNQNSQNNNKETSNNQNITQNDQIDTVKLQTKNLTTHQKIIPNSVIHINSQDQYEENNQKAQQKSNKNI